MGILNTLDNIERAGCLAIVVGVSVWVCVNKQERRDVERERRETEAADLWAEKRRAASAKADAIEALALAAPFETWAEVTTAAQAWAMKWKTERKELAGASQVTWAGVTRAIEALAEAESEEEQAVRRWKKWCEDEDWDEWRAPP